MKKNKSIKWRRVKDLSKKINLIKTTKKTQ